MITGDNPTMHFHGDRYAHAPNNRGVINLGDIGTMIDSTLQAINRIPPREDVDTAQLKPLLKMLTNLLAQAGEREDARQAAERGIDEVKDLAEQARQQKGDNWLTFARKKLGSIREVIKTAALGSKVAEEATECLDQIGDLLT